MDSSLINLLALKTISLLEESDNCDIEKACWMIVHEHLHGLMPFEYDIREIDETLYLQVLDIAKGILGNWFYFDYIINLIDLTTKLPI